MPDSPKPIPRFDETSPFDPDEFATAFTFAMNAGGHQATVTDPTKVGLNLLDDDGTVATLTFTDRPLNRMMMALKERYGHNPDKFVGAAARTMALITLLQEGVPLKMERNLY